MVFRLSLGQLGASTFAGEIEDCWDTAIFGDDTAQVGFVGSFVRWSAIFGELTAGLGVFGGSTGESEDSSEEVDISSAVGF